MPDPCSVELGRQIYEAIRDQAFGSFERRLSKRAGGRAPEKPVLVEHFLPKFRQETGRRQPTQVVYFIQSSSGAIKIGTSLSVRLAKRLTELQSGNDGDLSVIATLPGGLPLERRLHRKFRLARIRHNNEWFRPVEPLLAFVRRVAQAP